MLSFIITTVCAIALIFLLACCKVSGDLSEEERKELHDENI